jgi:hypothetical protein
MNRLWIWAIAVVLLGCGSLFAQTTSVSGTITDPTGAIVPGATVELESATGVRRTQTVDADGRYIFPQLAPGKYKLTVKSAGFSSKVINELELLVNNPATVNVSLEVGQITETVAVSAEAAQVNTQDATIGNAFSTKPILQLPFNARNVVGLLTLQPGVTFNGDINDYRSGSVAGGKSDQANVTLDGVDVNDQQDRTAFTSVLRVTLDSVQEFRVTTTNANADQGRSSGAQVALVTKSGTNELHGSLYWFLRNNATSANSFFNNLSGLPIAKLNRNIYGGSLGGPIVKNRLFLFGNFEGRQDRSADSVLRLVPSNDMRNGILKYVNNAGAVVTVPRAELASRVDPLGIGASQRVLDIFRQYPEPNDFTQGDGYNIVGHRFNAPIKLRQNTYIAKLDWRVDEAGNHTAFVRGNLQNDNSIGVPQFLGQAPNRVDLENSKGLATGLTSLLRPNLVNNFRYGFTRQGFEIAGVSTVSAVSFRGLSDPFGLTRSFIRITPVHNIVDDVSWTKGKHTVQAGTNIRIIRNGRTNYANSFNSASTNASWLVLSGATLNNPFPDMRSTFRVAWRDAAMATMGVVSQVNARYNYRKDGSVQAEGTPVVRNFHNEEYEFYIQDIWRMTRALTITAGLRYSLNPPVYEADGLQTVSIQPLNEWFNERLAYANVGQPQSRVQPIRYTLKENPGGRDFYPFHKKNFAPRLAVAYSPQATDGFLGWLFGGPGRTSIRAGWGMFYDAFGQRVAVNYDASAFGLSTQITNPSSQLTLATAPRFVGLNQLPSALVPPAPPGGFPQTAPNNFAIINSLDDALLPPYTMNMNFSIGREFGNGLFVQGSYVGRLSRRSLTSEDIATPTNIIDPASGIDYFEAAKYLAILANQNTPVAQVRPNAFWDNMFPGLRTSTLTPTQVAYQIYSAYAPDYTSGLYDLDVFCDPACSRLGPFAFFNRQYSYLRVLRSIGFGNYHGFQFTVRKRFRNNDQLDFNYTWSKSMDLGSAPERDTFGVITNPWSRRQFRAVSDYDTTHIFNANGVYNLPFGRGQKYGSGVGRFADAIIGGWQLSGIWRQTSGFPIAVGNGRFWPTNWNLTGNATQIAPVKVGTNKNAPAPTAGGRSGPNLFPNPAEAVNAFAYTLPGESGDRNTLRGDGAFTLDASLNKAFKLWSESSTLQLRWEVFNVTNSVRFDPQAISLNLGAIGTFGKYTGTIGSPRIMQFGARIDF